LSKFRYIFNKSPWDDFDSEGQNNENIFNKRKNNKFNFDNFQPNFTPKWFLFGILAFALLWLSSGIYKLEEGEQALVVRFGKFNRISGAGLNYHFPNPIEKIYIEKVDQSRRLEIGYRSSGRGSFIGNNSSTDVKTESIMLTGDENIVSLHVDVTWHISNLSDYIFNISDPIDTVKSVAGSAIREVIGNTPIASILSNQKQMIANKIERLMQSMLDQYGAGVFIEQVKLLRAEPPEEVIAAYRDVQTAKADKEKIINEAEAYKNDILPRARGEAAKIIEIAGGYKASIISRAEGDVARFNALYSQYSQNKEVMKSRLHMETMEYLLQNSNKIIIEGGEFLPHMALQQKNIFNNSNNKIVRDNE
jgi:membrane protease subunit HflK